VHEGAAILSRGNHVHKAAINRQDIHHHQFISCLHGGSQGRYHEDCETFHEDCEITTHSRHWLRRRLQQQGVHELRMLLNRHPHPARNRRQHLKSKSRALLLFRVDTYPDRIMCECRYLHARLPTALPGRDSTNDVEGLAFELGKPPHLKTDLVCSHINSRTIRTIIAGVIVIIGEGRQAHGLAHIINDAHSLAGGSIIDVGSIADIAQQTPALFTERFRQLLRIHLLMQAFEG
jgi:hypothetical protein